jgi:hypothetical protein
MKKNLHIACGVARGIQKHSCDMAIDRSHVSHCGSAGGGEEIRVERIGEKCGKWEKEG